MTTNSPQPPEPPCPASPPAHDPGQAPAFNAPVPVLLAIATFVLVHVWRTMFLSPAEDRQLLLVMAVVPALYDAWWQGAPLHHLPSGGLGLLLSPFGHFFLHANWMHLGMNALWMLVFGTPVARRLGGMRFLALSLLAAAAGAAAFLLLHPGADALLVGASGGISGLMGASVRLIYARNLPLAAGIRCDVRRVTPLTFTQALTLPRPRQFVLVWIAINVVISLVGFGGGLDRIAGEAHIAGFFAGMALLGPLDRR